MASTSANPSTFSSEIDALLSWNPPPLIPVSLPANIQKTTTRPSFYDRHLPENLRLREVKCLPSLIQDLTNNVDEVLAAASLPDLNGFITAQMRANLVTYLDRNVSNEQEVVTFYSYSTSFFCRQLASKLALYPNAPSLGLSLLCWTPAVSTSGYPIAEGHLRFIGEDPMLETIRKRNVDSMDSETRRIFMEMRKDRSALGTWVMKSPTTDTVEVITAVPNLGKFSWTSCAHPECSKLHTERQRDILNTVVGPDPRSPPWKGLNVDSLDTDSVDHDETLDIGKSTTGPVAGSAALATTSYKPSLQQSTSVHASSSKNKGKGKATFEPSQEPARRITRSHALSSTSSIRPLPSTSTHRPPSKNTRGTKARKRKRDDDNDEAFQDDHDLTAQSLVQQAWAQAVRVDGTIIVLHSGNHELVCVRHRQSQTLYVSEIIEPPTTKDPGYGKLHIGIYLAAVQDTIDRRKQQVATPQPKPLGDNDNEDQGGDRCSRHGRKDSRGDPTRNCRGGRGGSPGGRGDGLGKTVQSRKGREDPRDDDKLEVIEKTIQAAIDRNAFFLYLQYGIYDSPVPAFFFRSAPPITAHTKRHPTPPLSLKTSYSLEECLTITLTSEIEQGGTGIVHGGTLEVEESDESVPLDVVVKLAFSSQQRDALRSEHEIYRHLMLKGVVKGIARVLGFFDDAEGGPCALVMLYAGVSLSTMEQPLSVEDGKSALSILEAIHCAGILHGDIRHGNVLISDFGITIIDFGHSERCNDQRLKGYEYAQLRNMCTEATREIVES